MNRSILWDCHMHSLFSADSGTPIEAMIEKAFALGLSGICFTEHLDPDYPPTPDNLSFSLDLPAYRSKLFALRKAWMGKIDLRFGIELGLQPHLGTYFTQLLSENDFDFVIGSSHIVHGQDPYYPDFFAGRAQTDCYREYFDSILENLAAFDACDTYGHLDYVVRYGPTRNQGFLYRDYCDVIEQILRTLISKNIALELNTGGYHYGLGEPNPCTDILKRYRELGGELITIGADAHTPDKIAFAFDRAAQVLCSCGFRYYTVSRHRRPEFFPIKE